MRIEADREAGGRAGGWSQAESMRQAGRMEADMKDGGRMLNEV